MKRDGQAGFSLLEVLIVLALLATVSGATLISFRASGSALRPETEAQLLANRLSLAAGEALVTGDRLSLDWQATGYRIDLWSNEHEDWRPHPSGLFGADHEFPRGMAMDVEGSPERIAIRPDGTGDLAAVTISSSDASWRVSFDGLAARAAAIER